MLRTLGPVVAIIVAYCSAAAAQDTTFAYPWRVSYFPYPTVTPNDGLMGVARVILFRQSRWDDRVSLHDGIAIDAGYSTKDAWLARVKGDFPRIATGWRLQVIGEAGKLPHFMNSEDQFDAVSRQTASLEVSRLISGPVSVSLLGRRSHLTGTYATTLPGMTSATFAETDTRGRVALVIDLRDREYDTRRGALIQGGYLLGSSNAVYRNPYHGWYGLASGWMPLSTATRLTARIAGRTLSRRGIDAGRMIDAWEDGFVVGGGPESNRALPMAFRTNTKMLLAAAEVRHDLFVFPGGAIAVLGFVDAGRAYCACDFLSDVPGIDYTVHDWIVGPGGGIAIRLLRNAVLTSTIGIAKGKARFYVSSGWSW